MRIRHLFPSSSTRATVEGDRAFFLRNQLGDFLSLYTQNQTRYQGWFMEDSQGFYKLIENIGVVSPRHDLESVVGITNHAGHYVSWEYETGLQLTWKLLPDASGLSIFLSQLATLRLTLDIRHMYAQPTFGRQYGVKAENGGYTISYFDSTLSQPLYLHIRGCEQLNLSKEWVERYYPRDAARHSEPTHLYVYTLGDLRTSQLSIGAGKSPEEAILLAKRAEYQEVQLTNVGITHTHDTLISQIQVARQASEQALRDLEEPGGIFAGLPWFHQIWSRDELISSLGFSSSEQRELIRQYLGTPLQDGELPTFQGSHSTCADGVGWLCFLIAEYGLDRLDRETKVRLLHFLRQAHEGLQKSRLASHGLIASGHNATWMDTIGREGFRLEIQAMYALLLQHLFALSGDPTYEQEYIQMLGRIRQHFWQNNYLWDGLNDGSKRPNPFLAYLLQPNLLDEQSWQHCFDIILEATHCPWGGLSSLDHNHPDFEPKTSGENNLSYHNGDSWFFINNLAAIALHRFNPHLYTKTILELLQSSTQEILWQNMVGCPGEISSAEELDSFGCGIQAWSAGTYVALVKEIENGTLLG